MGVRDGYLLRERDGGAELRRVSIGRSLLGVLLCGLATGLYVLHRGGHVRTEGGGPASDLAIALFCAAFVLPGLGFLTYRSGLRIDALRGAVTTWWGFARPWSQRERRLEEFADVEVKKIVVSSGNNGSSTWYPVTLSGEEPLRLHRAKSPVRARRIAEWVARAAGKPLRNAIAGVETVRPPEQLDWSLRERLLDAGEAPDLPSQAPDSKLSVRPDGLRFLVEAPAPGMLRSGLVLLFLGAPGLLGAAAMMFFVMDGAPAFFMAFMAAGLVVPLLCLLAVIARRGLRGTRLEISPEEIRVGAVFPWGCATRVLAARAVEEVTVSDPARRPPILGSLIATGNVTLTTDREMVQFGVGLSDEDRAYVGNLIRHAVCRGAGPVPAPADAYAGAR